MDINFLRIAGSNRHCFRKAKAATDLKARRFLTVHHSKYALAKHRWDEPLENAEAMKIKDSLDVLMPEIGEVVVLK